MASRNSISRTRAGSLQPTRSRISKPSNFSSAPGNRRQRAPTAIETSGSLFSDKKKRTYREIGRTTRQPPSALFPGQVGGKIQEQILEINSFVSRRQTL